MPGNQISFVATLLYSLLLFCSGLEALAQERTQEASLEVKVYTYPEGNGVRCINVAFLIFEDEEDVTWNSISYEDTLASNTVTRTISPPFEDDFFLSGIPDGEFDSGEGEHQVSLSLSSAGEDEFNPGKCAKVLQDLNDRFSDAKVYFDRKLNKISGTVTQWHCRAGGLEHFELQRNPSLTSSPGENPEGSCVRGGVSSEVVIAKRIGRGTPRMVRTTTDSDGKFEMLVKNGKYRVGVKPQRRMLFDPRRSQRVVAEDNDVADIDFKVRPNRKLTLKVRAARGSIIPPFTIKPGVGFISTFGLVRVCNRSGRSHRHLIYGETTMPFQNPYDTSPGQCYNAVPTFTDQPTPMSIIGSIHSDDEYALVWVLPPLE